MTNICCKTLFTCSLLFVVKTQLNVNKVMGVFLFRGFYCHGVALEPPLLCFEILEHIGYTCDYFALNLDSCDLQVGFLTTKDHSSIMVLHVD